MLYTQSDSTRCVVDRISLILRTTDRVAWITVPNERPLRPPLLCVLLPPRRRITSLGNTLDDLLLLPTSWHHGGIAFRAWHSFMCHSSFRHNLHEIDDMCVGWDLLPVAIAVRRILNNRGNVRHLGGSTTQP